jgi:hypothetical protein
MKNLTPRSLFQSALLLGALVLHSAGAQASLTTDLQALNSQSTTLKTYLAATDIAASDACARLVEADRMARSIIDGIAAIDQGLTTGIQVDTTTLNELDALSGNNVSLANEALGLSTELNTFSTTADAFAIKDGITAMLQLSDDIGTMADRIGDMADKILVMSDNIGLMADRILVTQQLQSQNLQTSTNTLLTTQSNALQLVAVAEDSSYNVSFDSLITNGGLLAARMSAVVFNPLTLNTQLATVATDVRGFLDQVKAVNSTIELDGTNLTLYQTADALTKLTSTAAMLNGLSTALNGYVVALGGVQAMTTSAKLKPSLKSMLQLSADIGGMANRILEMADQILAMADNIGMQADQILATQSAMNGSVATTQYSILNAQTAVINLIVLRNL